MNATGLTPQEEAELRRENRFSSSNHQNAQIHFNNGPNNYNEREAFSRPSRPQSNEPVSLNLKPKPKYDNYRKVTNFAWQLFQVRIRFIFSISISSILRLIFQVNKQSKCGKLCVESYSTTIIVESPFDWCWWIN